MGLLAALAGKLGYAPKRAPGGARAGYDAAQLSRLTASLSSQSEFINTTLRHQLRILRARSRQAAQNNPFARRFAQMVVDNVCGPQPFRLEGKIKNARGAMDEDANKRVEAGWCGWGRKGQCEITGQWSWNAAQRLLVRSLAVDGELLIRKLRGPEYGRHGFRLQIIDVDRLWEYNTKALDGGGAIHASVEVDANSRPVAYHILKRKPAQWQYAGYTLEFERVPAEDIVHVFVPEFAEQIRGVPWMYAALLNLVHLGAFEEAAVIAARVGASNLGFIQSPDGGRTLAQQQGLDAAGAGSEPTINTDPGSFNFMPPGYQVQGWNPKYPDAAIEPFIRACLRGVAAGLGVAYHNLANDLENVNYSSARIGELDERDTWMGLQTFVTEHLHQPLYEDWLRTAVLAGVLPFDPARMDKYRDVYWRARRWAWVDPLKEVGAAIEAVNARLKSRTEVIAEGGGDIEDTFEEISAEQKLAADAGIALEPVQPKTSGAVDTTGGDGGEEPAANAGGKKGARWRDAARGANPEDALHVHVHNNPVVSLAVPDAVKHQVAHHVTGMDELVAEIARVGPSVEGVMEELRKAEGRPVHVKDMEGMLGRLDEALTAMREDGERTRATLKIVQETTHLSAEEVRRLGEIASARRIFVYDRDGNPIGSEPVLAP